MRDWRTIHVLTCDRCRRAKRVHQEWLGDIPKAEVACPCGGTFGLDRHANEPLRPPLEDLPDDVTLCGIGYRTSVSEGTVIFTSDAFGDRIVFERDVHDPLADLWYVEVRGRVPAGHVRDAYALVCEVFGGSFVKKLSKGE